MVYAFGGAVGGQTNYTRNVPVGMPGTLEGFAQYGALPYINSASGKQATYTITSPGTVDASSDYTLTIDGVTIKYTTTGSPTTAALAAGLLAAIKAEPLIYRKYEATIASNVITLTARLLNVPATITSPSNASTTNDLTIANTVTVGTEVRIPFGVFVGRTTSFSTDPVTGLSPAAVIDSASGYEVLGITLKQFVEKDRIGPQAQANYSFMSVLNVLNDCGANKGVWVQAADPDINMLTDTPYIAVSGANAGKVTKSNSGTVDISSRAKFVSNTMIGINNIALVLLYFGRGI